MLSGIAADLENPENSRVVGKLGYSPIPAPDGKGTYGVMSFFCWFVAENSPNKEAAFKLSAWLTSKVQLTRLNLENCRVTWSRDLVRLPVRVSAN